MPIDYSEYHPNKCPVCSTELIYQCSITATSNLAGIYCKKCDGYLLGVQGYGMHKLILTKEQMDDFNKQIKP